MKIEIGGELFSLSDLGRKYEHTMIDKMVLLMVLLFHFNNQWSFVHGMSNTE